MTIERQLYWILMCALVCNACFCCSCDNCPCGKSEENTRQEQAKTNDTARASALQNEDPSQV